MNKFKDVLPLCEEILGLGIGFPELAAFHAAVIKRVETEGLPMGAAPYRLMEDIQNYNKLNCMKKQLQNMGMILQIMNEITARSNKAITSLFNLQAYGIRDDEIVNMHHILNGARLENAARP